MNKIEIILHKKNLLKDLSSETVKNMVKSELKMYDADKTGRTDYALESSGYTLFNSLFLLTFDFSLFLSLMHVCFYFPEQNIFLKEYTNNYITSAYNIIHKEGKKSSLNFSF